MALALHTSIWAILVLVGLFYQDEQETHTSLPSSWVTWVYLSYHSPLDLHQAFTWPRDECRGQGEIGALADKQGKKEVGFTHGKGQPGPPGLAYRIIKCNEVLIQSHDTKFHWRQGKQGIYSLHFSPSLKTPASSVSPGPVSILHMCVVTSDMGIPPCKISWIKSYCFLQLYSHHSLHITATANIMSTRVISKPSARVFHESHAIVLFSYDVTSREPRLHACSHLQLLPVWPGL